MISSTAAQPALTSTDRDRLIVLDERTSQMAHDVAGVRRSLEAMKEIYVSRVEFAPVKVAVYGLIGMICTGVIGALITVVIRSH